ncbi:unnamed protein product [Caenorhabditis auriculariae]|uniref:Uncharacterized protein n=1 Tax=Caenorhabditis auriculariae TaxID=2777116 RepID=A0A8S1GSI3_9PELO|nr:unnamed protein product [Caenorhabditis auriculariae]
MLSKLPSRRQQKLRNEYLDKMIKDGRPTIRTNLKKILEGPSRMGDETQPQTESPGKEPNSEPSIVVDLDRPIGEYLSACFTSGSTDVLTAGRIYECYGMAGRLNDNDYLNFLHNHTESVYFPVNRKERAELYHHYGIGRKIICDLSLTSMKRTEQELHKLIIALELSPKRGFKIYGIEIFVVPEGMDPFLSGELPIGDWIRSDNLDAILSPFFRFMLQRLCIPVEEIKRFTVRRPGTGCKTLLDLPKIIRELLLDAGCYIMGYPNILRKAATNPQIVETELPSLWNDFAGSDLDKIEGIQEMCQAYTQCRRKCRDKLVKALSDIRSSTVRYNEYGEAVWDCSMRKKVLPMEVDEEVEVEGLNSESL